MGFGIYEAIKSIKLREGNNFNYSEGFKVGFITGFISTLIFTIFFILYATEINPAFLEELIASMNYELSIGLLAFTVGIMGLATTVILTLAFMQLFKSNRNLL